MARPVTQPRILKVWIDAQLAKDVKSIKLMAGRQAIMDLFEAEGVEFIFGNPGTTELGFLDILQDYPQIQYIMCARR